MVSDCQIATMLIIGWKRAEKDIEDVRRIGNKWKGRNKEICV